MDDRLASAIGGFKSSIPYALMVPLVGVQVGSRYVRAVLRVGRVLAHYAIHLDSTAGSVQYGFRRRFRADKNHID
jgi:hypothetical protein